MIETALSEELSEEELAELRSRIRDYKEGREEEFLPLERALRNRCDLADSG